MRRAPAQGRAIPTARPEPFPFGPVRSPLYRCHRALRLEWLSYLSSQFSQKVRRTQGHNTILNRLCKVSQIVGDDVLRPARQSTLEHQIVIWIRQTGPPQEINRSLVGRRAEEI